jgi:dihydrofolate reductase
MPRKILAGLFMSLDGVCENPGTWSMPYFNDQVGQIIGANTQNSDAMLLGRRTYEEWVAYWPGKTADDDPFADYINNVPKYVVSRTLKEPLEWEGSTLITGTDGIRELKQKPGKGMAISGSITLVGSLLREGMVDELALLVSPLVIGSGKRLFDSPEQVPLELIECTPLDNGVLSLRYSPGASG